MSTIAEIEMVIEQLPTPEVDELAAWLEAHRARRTAALVAEAWLKQARGAALPDVTTADIMSITRGEK